MLINAAITFFNHMQLTLQIIKEPLTLHRYAPEKDIPSLVLEQDFFSINKTSQELSIVCSSSLNLDSVSAEPGWFAIQVIGPLDFSLTGILADLSNTLAQAEISIFAISTFDTDYILIKEKRIEDARRALTKAGYSFR